jgi:predicted Zn finger-like uncharacterized protein
MNMFTRCPHCDTVFRVTPQQLQVSSGQVRCGRCQEVFDAFATLTSRLPGGRLEEVAAVQAEQPVRRYQASITREEAAPAAPAVRGEPAAPVRPPAVASGSAAPSSAPEPEILTLPPEVFGTDAGTARRWPWALGCLGAAVALAAQAAWFFPVQLGLQLPGLRPLLVQYCAWTGCKAELPQAPDLLFIEASDLQLLDPARPSEVLLTASVRNRAGFEQALPLLELTLTDHANRTAARKVFKPAEYLGTTLEPHQGIGAGQEVSIRLYLDTGEVKAAGYRLYLFFA